MLTTASLPVVSFPSSQGGARSSRAQCSVFLRTILTSRRGRLQTENTTVHWKSVARPSFVPLKAAMTYSSNAARVSSLSVTCKTRSKTKRKSQPVLLNAAVQRMLQQESWSQRLRTMFFISSFVLADVAWWLREGVWHIPGTLSAARNRYTVHLVEEDKPPAFDVYAPPAIRQYITGKLNNQPDFDDLEQNSFKPIVLYVHGGGWGTGHSSHYSQLATKIVEATHSPVLVLSYRLYPSAMISDQAHAVTTALRRIRSSFPSRKVIVLAHSSGAHITSLALLKEAETPQPSLLADVVIFTAGPFHLMHHFLFESQRGVALASPMLPAAMAETDHTKFDEWSPTVIAERFLEIRTLTDNSTYSVPVLEGQLPAKNIHLPDPTGGGLRIPFPKTFIMASTCDTVVPMYSSLRFATALRKTGLSCELLIYDFVAHIDWVLDWSATAKPRDLSGVLDTGKPDYLRRKACVTHLGGKEIASLMKREEQASGPSAHVRDVLRIIKSVAKDDMQDC
ncbi:hypothetical protein FGB62_44g134 [Gracilaria domingensis]|nr:hypothetical protein FGB62_44g134 [Gracilaria domingensis]